MDAFKGDKKLRDRILKILRSDEPFMPQDMLDEFTKTDRWGGMDNDGLLGIYQTLCEAISKIDGITKQTPIGDEVEGLPGPLWERLCALDGYDVTNSYEWPKQCLLIHIRDLLAFAIMLNESRAVNHPPPKP